MPKRFQFDSQWQQDFRALARAIRERGDHVAACKRLHDEGKLDEARRALALADEAQERIALLEHALRDL